MLNLKTQNKPKNLRTGCHFYNEKMEFGVYNGEASEMTQSDHLTKQQQNLRLSIRQRITLYMVAVVVKVHGKPAAQPLPILLR